MSIWVNSSREFPEHMKISLLRLIFASSEFSPSPSGINSTTIATEVSRECTSGRLHDARRAIFLALAGISTVVDASPGVVSSNNHCRS
jgi:hypothetical protein